MKKVLVVDDELVICKTVKRALRMDGVLASFALSSREALDMLESQTFNLVITDIKMPGMDGIAFMKVVRKNIPGMTILAISGFATDEMATEVHASGAYKFLSKPFEIKDLLRDVRSGFDLKRGKIGKRFKSE